MARPQRIHVRNDLRALVSKAVLEAANSVAGFVSRSRKLDLFQFVWTLVWGFGVGADRTLTALHRTYSSSAAAKISVSAFSDWFRKPGFPRVMRAIVDQVLDKLNAEEVGNRRQLAGELAQFRELLAADSSVVRLHSSLQRSFPGTRTNHSPASLKVHLVQKVAGAGVAKVKITEGKRSDSKTLKLGDWIRGSLLLIDLGYYDFAKFARVDKLGGYFISRVKTGANPVIEKSLLNCRGQAVPVEGEKLQDVLGRFQRKVIDLQVTVRFQPRVYDGKRSTKRQTLRLVGVWNEAEGRYHLYFTNLSPSQLSAEAIAEAYRLRWQVELLFRSLKKVHGLGKIRVLNEHAVVGLVYAAFLSLLVTRRLLELIRAKLGLVEADATLERGAKVVQEQAVHLLRIVVLPPRDLGRLELDVERTLLDALPDRNKNRRVLVDGYMNLMGQPTG